MHARFQVVYAALTIVLPAVSVAAADGSRGRSAAGSSRTRTVLCPVDDTGYNDTPVTNTKTHPGYNEVVPGTLKQRLWVYNSISLGKRKSTGYNDTAGVEDAARCFCTASGDIRCRGGVHAVPKLVIDHARHAHGQNAYGGFYAAGQEIDGVPAYAFSELSIARIVLDFNPIGHRQGLHPHAFAGFSLGLTLRELHLGGCRLTQLPVSLIGDLVDLRRLHLWANELELFPVGLFSQPGGGGSNLVELSLWGNRIEEIERRTFEGLRRLRVLDLDRNRIYMIDARAFAAVPKLRCLRLAGNNIRVIYEDTFLSVPNLQVLNLDRNGLGYVYTSAFNAVSALLSLSLSDNVIGFLPDDVFSALRRLRDLRLAHNRLTHVWAGTFAGLSQLVILDLAGNHLVHLPPGAFRHAPFLRHVRLDDNRLTALDRCSVLASVPPSLEVFCDVLAPGLVPDGQCFGRHIDHDGQVLGSCLAVDDQVLS